jgi:hypothetical protein
MKKKEIRMKQLNIPKKLHVGFQNREDTYTKKLAYVIYVDEKGKLRKEYSWNNWRDEEIPVEIYDNEPTTGFVLNKKVGGGCSYGWNHRNAYIRVFDPRGFEFEISPENLLYILENSSCIVGKGLEGEFVYSWEKKDLVLLPVNTQDYNNSKEYTSLKTMKITKKDMLEGCIYLDKNNKQWMYLGRREYFIEKTDYHSHRSITTFFKKTKGHIFADLDKETDKTSYYTPPPYWFTKGFTQLSKRLTTIPASDYADILEEFQHSKYASLFKEFVATKVDLKKTPPIGDYGNVYGFLKKGDEYFYCVISRNYQKGFFDRNKTYQVTMTNYPAILNYSDNIIFGAQNYLSHNNINTLTEYYSEEELLQLDLYTLSVVNKYGVEVIKL